MSNLCLHNMLTSKAHGDSMKTSEPTEYWTVGGKLEMPRKSGYNRESTMVGIFSILRMA